MTDLRAQWLLTPKQVRERMSDPGVLLVDARSVHEYRTGHLPGAVSCSLYDYHWADTSDRGLEGFAAEMTRAFGSLGIGPETFVIFYEGFSGMNVARGIWTCEYLGHERVAMMDGGMRAWTAAGFPVESAPGHPNPAVFRPRVRPERVASLSYIMDRMKQPGLQLVDARTLEEYTGAVARAPRGGTIPGSTHVEWTRDLAQDGTWLPDEALDALYGGENVAPGQEVVTFCQGGYRAAHAYLALRMLGYPNVRMYLGSWAEWGSHAETPVVAGV